MVSSRSAEMRVLRTPNGRRSGVGGNDDAVLGPEDQVDRLAGLRQGLTPVLLGGGECAGLPPARCCERGRGDGQASACFASGRSPGSASAAVTSREMRASIGSGVRNRLRWTRHDRRTADCLTSGSPAALDRSAGRLPVSRQPKRDRRETRTGAPAPLQFRRRRSTGPLSGAPPRRSRRARQRSRQAATPTRPQRQSPHQEETP